MKSSSMFSIIIPTRNERNNLEKLLPEILRLYPHIPVWIVDDNSSDGTYDFMTQYSTLHPNIHFIRRVNKRGRGSAVVDGLKEAAKEKNIPYFLEMDADFSHNPAEIGRLIDCAGPNTIVIGSRHIKNAEFIHCSPFRIILSKLANRYARLVLGVPIADYTNGFRVYPGSACKILAEVKIHEKGYIVLSETAFILYKNGFEFKEVPTIFLNRTIGRSHATVSEFIKSIPAILNIRLKH